MNVPLSSANTYNFKSGFDMDMSGSVLLGFGRVAHLAFRNANLTFLHNLLPPVRKGIQFGLVHSLSVDVRINAALTFFGRSGTTSITMSRSKKRGRLEDEPAPRIEKTNKKQKANNGKGSSFSAVKLPKTLCRPATNHKEVLCFAELKAAKNKKQKNKKRRERRNSGRPTPHQELSNHVVLAKGAPDGTSRVIEVVLAASKPESGETHLSTDSRHSKPSQTVAKHCVHESTVSKSGPPEQTPDSALQQSNGDQHNLSTCGKPSRLNRISSPRHKQPSKYDKLEGYRSSVDTKIECAPASIVARPQHESLEPSISPSARLARDRDGLRQAKQLSRAGALRKCGSAEQFQIQTVEEKLFFVDEDGDPALQACESLHPFTALPTDEEILGSSFYSNFNGTRQLVSGFELCSEQEALVRLVMDGHNVFFTGSAGSGKSHVLRAFYQELIHEGKRVSKIGPTGISALNIGGQTTYRFAGWRPSSKKKHIRRLEREARIGERWERLNEVDVLVIDETSMVDSHHFSRLDRVCRAARQPQPPINEDGSRDYDVEVEWSMSDEYGSDKDRSPHDHMLPFGGIQVIVTGDFCQLPPVMPFRTCFPCGKTTRAKHCDNGPWMCDFCKLTFYPDDCWAFQSPAWRACRFKNVRLVEVHRQKDPMFVEILEAFRDCADLTCKQFQTIYETTRHEVQDAIHLFPTNRGADRMNSTMLSRIQEPTKTYASVDDFTWNEIDRSHRKYGERGSGLRINYLVDHRFSDQLDIKIGMPVMLLVGGSSDSDLVNGSQGTVVGFEIYDHAQPSKAPATVPSPISAEHDEYPEYRSAMIGKWFARTNVLPVVEFSNGQRLLIYPSCEIEEFGDDEPYSLLSRTQLPIRPGWALTIHKSQGLTLERVVLHVDGVRTREMLYVGISRATSLEGLQIVTKNDLAILKPGGRLGPWNSVVKAFSEHCFGKPKSFLSDK